MSKRITLAVLAVFALTLFTAVQVSAQVDSDTKNGSNNRADPSDPRTRPASGGGARADVFGTIIYDDGTVTAAPAVSSYAYGNQFDSNNGNPILTSGTVASVSFFILSGAGTDNVFVTVFDQQNGTTANVLASISVPLNNGSGTFNTASVGGLAYANQSFLAGVWYIAGDTVGLGSGTNGMGHHGMAINDIVATDFQTLPGLNALVGASGDVLIPVELMGFDVE